VKTLVIVPAYNEERNIPIVIEELRAHLPGAEVLVVNDGSRDATADVARAGGATVLDLPMNLGIGGAMQAGFVYAHRGGFEAAVQFDGDAQHRGDQLRLILGPLEEGHADVIVGSRFVAGGPGGNYRPPLLRRVGIRLFARVLSALTGWPLTDTTSGFRAYGARAIALFAESYPEDYPEVEALLMLKKAGLAAGEVPVLMRERPWGTSSITPFRSIYYTVKVLLAVFIGSLRAGRAAR
jgi:hypothetical protein